MKTRKPKDRRRPGEAMLTAVVALAVAGCIWGIADGFGVAHSASAPGAVEATRPASSGVPAPQDAITHDALAGLAPDEAVPSF